MRPSRKIPIVYDWRTSDEDEIQRRRLRAQSEEFRISNADPSHPVFSDFRVVSRSGLTYSVEIRGVLERSFFCGCGDFRKNGLGTCKHIEAVLFHLEAKQPRKFQKAIAAGSNRIDIVLDRNSDAVQIERGMKRLPLRLRRLFDAQGYLKDEGALDLLGSAGLPGLRISQEVASWVERRLHERERMDLRREYERKVQSGEWPPFETLVPLYPYQREGMLHLAFTERAMLSDEMGLGKTIQAIAACALLYRMGKVSRVLVVTPASLKAEWEEQIQRFTPLTYQIVFGRRNVRISSYRSAPFFTIVNYEQMIPDSLEVNHHLKPDVVILDEAQRIKNWNTKTAQAAKRLQSRYAFVLTGTPIENRIDELYSLMDFLNPAVFGPLFRFNREFYILDDRGRPGGYRNLDKLHERIAPVMLRRRKLDVEDQLPSRTDRNYLVPMSEPQKILYEEHEARVAKLVAVAKRRPLSEQEQQKLMRELAMMRMLCDTPFILDPGDRTCPKLGELKKVLQECCDNPETKLIVFSEWERMLDLVRDLCSRLNLGFACHTGSVPQRKRRTEINRFKNDPQCRVFLSTDSGSTGLNLQAANMVINCDLPWNPARLEQRVARCWRKHQTRPVTIINLVTENTIEHRMLATLAMKQALADGVLDRQGDLKEIRFASGRQVFLTRLEQLLNPASSAREISQEAPVADRALAFSHMISRKLGTILLRCEERHSAMQSHAVIIVVVDRDSEHWQKQLHAIHQQFFGNGNADSPDQVRLQVIDRATDLAMNRLIEAGLLAFTIRVGRILYPDPDTVAGSFGC